MKHKWFKMHGVSFVKQDIMNEKPCIELMNALKDSSTDPFGRQTIVDEDANLQKEIEEEIKTIEANRALRLKNINGSHGSARSLTDRSIDVNVDQPFSNTTKPTRKYSKSFTENEGNQSPVRGPTSTPLLISNANTPIIPIREMEVIYRNNRTTLKKLGSKDEDNILIENIERITSNASSENKRMSEDTLPSLQQKRSSKIAEDIENGFDSFDQQVTTQSNDIAIQTLPQLVETTYPDGRLPG
jgi:hypothetical protein